MAFIVEDGTGLDNSNSLASVAEFKEYYEDRGVDISSLTDANIESLLIKGTDYIVQKYGDNFIGEPLKTTQALPFPRVYNGETIFPVKVKYATIVLALKANTTTLYEDTEKSVIREKVEGLEIEYDEYASSAVVYNEAVGYLRPYLTGGDGSYKVCRT